MKKEKIGILVAGLLIGVIAAILVLFGNPANMGFCIACFVRDTVGALGLHRAGAVQYIRPEIIGIILGSFVIALARREFRPKGGSAPITRFVLGFFVMIGCLMALGCPFRMVIRIAGGDINALIAIGGFALGIGTGVIYLKKGYSLGRNYKQPVVEGLVMPVWQIVLLVLLIVAPAFIFFSEEGAGPGAKHAPLIISLIAGLIVGGLAQRTRLCMAGGFRDIFLVKDFRLIIGFVGILIGAVVINLILTAATGNSYFNIGMSGQPVAHSDVLWNILGMYLVGLGSVLLGGCPLRQLVLSGEGNSDSALTVLGLGVGAAFAHNFGLASSADGPTTAGKIAVVIGIVLTAIIGIAYTKKND